MKSRLFFPLALMILLSGIASAQNETCEPSGCPPCDQNAQLVFGVLSVMAVFAILYSYRLTQGKSGLESRLRRNKEVLLKQRDEIQANDLRISKQKEILSEQQERKVVGEMKKSMEKASTGHVHKETLRREYWDKIGRISESMSTSTSESELKQLLEQQSEVKKMIELTKSKYYQRSIDEASFNEITMEYQKQLIEIESKISKLKSEGGKNE
ncbi:MAG: hypothetical protein ABIH11_08395 [Candidatus Altiarchaeota archaeon]